MEKRVSIAVESEDKVAGVVAKSGAMYLGIIALWLLSLAWFIPRLAALGGDLSALNTGLLVFVLFCLTLFWFYGFHFLGFFLFTLMARRARAPVASEDVASSLPRVAVLYPTADDFELEAVQSCVDQQYPDFHVFLLDDSSAEAYQARVDSFHKEHPEQTTVIRRGDRQGYKAGNINNALGKIGADYELFAVCDSDNILPADFLVRMVPHFSDDPALGFAQASHRRNRVDTDPFVRDMEHLANVRWEYHNLPRNRQGMVFCLGHGAVLRVEAWRQAGGFPPIVSEDIGLALAMRQRGFHGRFVPDVVCQEGIPPSLAAWRKAHFRMVTADLECFFRSVTPVVTAREIRLVERVDAVARTLQIPLSGLFLPFVIAVAVLLPALEDSAAAVSVLNSWQLLALTLVVALSGYLRFAVDVYPRVAVTAKFMSQFTALQLSLLSTSLRGLLTYAVVRRAHFFVTRATEDSDKQPGENKAVALLAEFDLGRPGVWVLEVLLAAGFIYLAAITLNWVLLGVALAILVMMARHFMGWGWLPGKVLVHVPVILLLVGAVAVTLGSPGVPGQAIILAGLPVLIYS